MKRTWLVLGIIIVLLIGGYVTYDYLKEKPPTALIALLTNTKPPQPLPAGTQAPLQVPEGFTATIYARDVPGARVLTRDQNATLLVSSTKEGKVFALPDRDGNGISDPAVTVLRGLKQPHGILVRCNEMGEEPCILYVAETGALVTYDYDADTYTATRKETLATFPTGNGHYTRTLLPHPNNEDLLISVGSSCNVCKEAHPMRATVQALHLADNQIRTLATGLRNTVFMNIHPIDGSIWGTDNGRDVIGDDIPPDEINIIEEGKNYGWPYCYGKQVPDADFEGTPGICGNTAPSHIDLPAHSAALGLAFVPEEGWPEEWWYDLLVAYHGSWNRSEPTGYKVVRIDLDTRGNMKGISDFVTGFLPSGGDEDDAIGRPVDVRIEPGGTVYITDDRAGAVYKIQRTEPAM